MGRGSVRGAEYLADGHHVDDAGNLISCTYVDFREAAERSPIATLQKASSQRHVIPGCGTIRISKPSCFLEYGEGLVIRGGEGGDGPGPADASAGMDATPADAPGAVAGETCYGRNGWIFCASIKPETPAERSAWREATAPAHSAVSPIHRPRAFARALGAMAAEQAGPRGRTVLLRNTVDGEAFSTAHTGQTVYHGPVVYSDDPVERLQRATSDLELLLLLVFLKDAAHRVQREYRFVVWAEKEPEEDRLDLAVSPALLEAMQTPWAHPDGGGFVPAGMEESSTVEATDDDGHPRTTLLVEAPAAFQGGDGPPVAPRRYDVERLPSDLREAALVYGTVEALRYVVARSDAGGRRDAAAAAWHAESIVRFFCSTFGDAIAGVRVSEESHVVITAELAGNGLVEATIAVGPDGTCACRISAGETHIASTAPDTRSFEQVLKERLAEVGVRGQDGAAD